VGNAKGLNMALHCSLLHGAIKVHHSQVLPPRGTHRVTTERTVNEPGEPGATEGIDSRYLEEWTAATNASQLLEVDPT